MLSNAARVLAALKGFALRNTSSTGQYHLIDGTTGLPAVNLERETLWFTLGDAVAFLDPLHEAVLRPD